jgi:hypothetical protein
MLILKIVAPNGKITTGKLSNHALIKAGAGHRYELVDSVTGLVPDDIRLKRLGRKLVLQSESQQTTLELLNFYPVADNVPPSASVSLPGAPAATTESVGSLASETASGRVPGLDLALSGDDLLAEQMTGFEAFAEPIQFAQANTGTMNDLLAAAPTEAGAAGSGSAGAGAAAGEAGAATGAGAAAGGAAAAGTGVGIGAVAAGAAGLAAVAGAGGGGGTAAAVAVAAKTAAGVAVDGYLSNAVVFRDANNNKIWDHEAFVDTNNNGVWDTGETFTDTNANGSWTAETFVLTDSQGKWTGLGGDASTGKIVLTGLVAGNGTVLTKDISTGKTFNQVLSAQEGSTVISPVTTMINKLVEKGKTLAQAEDEIAESFGIDTTISLSTYDPLASATGTGASTAQKTAALAIEKLNIQLASILSVASQSANKVDPTQTTAENSDAVFEALFAKIDAAGAGAVDLSSTAVIQGVFDGIATTLDPTKQASFQALDDNIVASLVSITNAIENVSLGADVTTSLTQIIGTQLVAETNLVSAVNTAVDTGGAATVDASAFDGANLLNAIDAGSQLVEDIVPTTSTSTTIGEPSRPVIAVGTGSTTDTRLSQADIDAGVHIKVTLVGGTIASGATVPTGGSLALAGDKLVLLLNGTKVAEYTLLSADIPATASTTVHVFDNVDLGTDGSKSLIARLERGTTVGPSSPPAITTVDTAATAASNLALVAADDTGVSSTDGFTSKTTLKIQGNADFGSTVSVTDGTSTVSATADSSGKFVASFTGLAAGSHSFTATATDVAGNVAAASPAATVFISTAPTGSTIASQALAEDAQFSLDASAVFSDVDVGASGDVLSYSATGLPTGITINASSGVISGATGDAGVGSHTVVVTATDKAGATATSSFNLAVSNINDAPVGAVGISGFPAKTQTLTATTGTLVDDDGLGTFSYQWQMSTDGTTFTNVSGATSAALPALTLSDVGKFFRVVVSYTDAHGTAETSTSAATAAVRDNQPPTGSVLVAGTVKQYETLTVSNTLADADSPTVAAGQLAVTYTWQSSTDGNTWTDQATGSSVTLTSESLVGQFVRVLAKYTDGFGTQESPSSAVATVANTNDAPSVSSGATATVAENATTSTVVYTATGTDPDAGTTLTYALGGTDAASFDINGSTGVVTLKASANFEAKASYSISVTANDGALSSAAKAVTVTVTNVNEAPAFTSAASGSIAENAATTTAAYTAVAVDPEGTAVTYSLGGTDAASFDINASTGAVTLKASANYEAKPTYLIDVSSTDGTLSATQAVTINVTNVNEAPTVANPIADTVASKDIAFNFVVPTTTFADVDSGDTLTYSATTVAGGALPAWLSFNATTHTFSGTPTTADLGTVQVRVTGKDSGNLSATEDFAITVSSNAAPTVAANTTAAVSASSASLNLSSLFTDVGDTLTYAITSGALPTGLSLSNGVISGTVASANIAAPAAVGITATDSFGLTASTSLKLYVSSVGALIPVVTRGNFDLDGDGTGDGDRIKLELKYDSSKDPDAGGVGALDVTVRYDSVNFGAYSEAPTASPKSIFTTGNTGSTVVASEATATPGVISVGWIRSPATTANNTTLINLFFDVKNDTKAFQAKTDITGYDSIPASDTTTLSALATHAWLLTT